MSVEEQLSVLMEALKADQSMKTCHFCKREKGLSEFYRDKLKKDGYCPNCKECFNLCVAVGAKRARELIAGKR